MGEFRRSKNYDLIENIYEQMQKVDNLFKE